MNELNVRIANRLIFEIGKNIGIECFLNERIKNSNKPGAKIEKRRIIKSSINKINYSSPESFENQEFDCIHSLRGAISVAFRKYSAQIILKRKKYKDLVFEPGSMIKFICRIKDCSCRIRTILTDTNTYKVIDVINHDCSGRGFELKNDTIYKVFKLTPKMRLLSWNHLPALVHEIKE